MILFYYKNSQSFDRVMCSVNLLKGVEYVVTQRTQLRNIASSRTDASEAMIFLLIYYIPSYEQETALLVGSMTVLRELYAYTFNQIQN